MKIDHTNGFNISYLKAKTSDLACFSIGGSIDNYVTGVSESSQQSSNLKDINNQGFNDY
ncbi:hypothetical protein PAU_01535 [Photorhabdus asymbiotica]|uniref:Uncharacterized protein n=1 Tax=Photorhabdus asymbiotica subsp. asymbiotica (strain ATCC 43949 / 3105-77) TaxID=553480 RepID=B6VKR7_PHOAA|nr:hypothetical protein PAU_01535 [Photorhabdus asymbiotica]CAR66747.1 hypothetical protein PA-RVA4-3949 [Photorhabdus asymbiotica subsp. asymbiotica ATCC 43949]